MMFRKSSIVGYGLYLFFILSAILLFHGLNNYHILMKSRYCFGLDSVNYFKRTVDTLESIKRVKPGLGSFSEVYHHFFSDSYKPPLYFSTAIPFLSFGRDINALIMSNLIYFAVLIFSTYGIGKQLYDRRVGMLSAFLVSVFPSVFALSRLLMVDLALSAMAALTFYLFTLNRFASLKFSLLTGMVIGLSSFVKQSYFIFLLPPLFYFFLQNENLKNNKVIRNFIISVMLGLLISAVYYSRVRYNYIFMFQAKTNISPFFYLYSLATRQLSPFFFLLFLLGIFMHFKERKYFLPLTILVLVAAFSLSPNKTDRFILPVFPYIAVLISATVISCLRFRKLAVTSLVLFGLLQYYIISYGNVSPFLINLLLKSPLKLYVTDTKNNGHDNGLFSVTDEGNWRAPGEEIIGIIRDNINQGGKKASILFIIQDWRIYSTVWYLAIVKGLDVEFRDAQTDMSFRFRLAELGIDEDCDNQIKRSSIIIKEQIPPERKWLHTKCLSGALGRNIDKFEFISPVRFPDGSLCYIYKNLGKSMYPGNKNNS